LTDIQRRTVLVGVAATVASIGAAGLFPKPAEAQEAGKTDEQLFADLSAILTGFDPLVLAPNVDPTQLNHEIFAKVNEDSGRANTLKDMLRRFPDIDTKNMTPEQRQQQTEDQHKAVAAMVSTWDTNDPTQVAMCFLGRSIILAWYLGAWYDPKALEKQSYAKPDAYYAYRRYSKSVLIPHAVLSPTAYTTSLVWRVMQAHPMGYSNMQFGYWGTQPPDLNLFTNPIKVPTT
jgi:hypothetical protein